MHRREVGYKRHLLYFIILYCRISIWTTHHSIIHKSPETNHFLLILPLNFLCYTLFSDYSPPPFFYPIWFLIILYFPHSLIVLCLPPLLTQPSHWPPSSYKYPAVQLPLSTSPFMTLLFHRKVLKSSRMHKTIYIWIIGYK